jgi:hypothetical protein
MPVPLTIVPSEVKAPGNQVERMNKMMAVTKKRTTLTPKTYKRMFQSLTHVKALR